MKKREQPKNGRKLLYILAVLLGLMAGCADMRAMKDMTAEQRVDYRIQKQFAILEARAERHDKLRKLKENCSHRGLVWWINGNAHFSRWDVRRMDKNPGWFPNGANIGNFACITSAEAKYLVEQLLR